MVARRLALGLLGMRRPQDLCISSRTGMTVAGKSGQAWGRGFHSNNESLRQSRSRRPPARSAGFGDPRPVQDGRIHIEKINYPFLYTLKAGAAEFGAGIRCAVEKGWLDLHESGTYVRLLTAVGT